MATFNATNSGANMLLLFSWVDGIIPIDFININNGLGFADVYEDISDGYFIKYTGSAFTKEDTIPTGGAFTSAEIYVPNGGYVLKGTLSGVTTLTDNFEQIVTEEAYRILDGDDTLNGGTASDTLFGGYGGSDFYVGGGGGDTFMVAAGTTPQGIFGTNTPTDTITVLDNDQTGSSTLDLRGATLSSIDKLVINDGLALQLNSDQIGPGVSSNATILSAFGAGLLFISMNTAALNLSGFTVTGEATLSILGANADEVITGSNGNDTLTPGNGADTVNGLGGNDTFNVIGTSSEFDTFNGGSGSDTLEIFGATALKLNGFDAASQAIEAWEGSGQALEGNGNANVFNLAGLTTKAGLTAINGLGGNDTITGSKFADTIAASGTEAQFDTMNGGLGTDTFRVAGSGPVTLSGFNAASQSIEVWDGNGQSLLGNGGANAFNLAGLTGMTALPFVEGLDGNDTMTGSKFADHLRGGDGDDTISAGIGADELKGGLGVDTLTGGADGDRFDFDAVAEIGKKKAARDIITDFTTGDRIDLSTIAANSGQRFKFKGKEGSKLKKAGDLVYDQIDKKGTAKDMTVVSANTDGNKKADFAIELKGIIDLEKGDFVL